MIKKIFCVSLLVLLATLSVPKAFAKPAPPAALLAIFNDFSELEDYFEKNKWDSALKETRQISERFDQMRPELKKTVAANDIEQFSALMENMKRSLTSKNAKNTLTVYIALQNLFFKIMDEYEYKLPPVVMITDKYVDEALSELKEKAYDEVVGEMDEIAGFFAKYVERHLKAKNVPAAELTVFKTTLNEVKDASKAKNSDKSLQGLNKLKRMSEKYVKLFKS